jgi:hypothetical protein
MKLSNLEGLTCADCASFLPPGDEEQARWADRMVRKPVVGPCPGACWVAFLKHDDPRLRRCNTAETSACDQFTPRAGLKRQASLL